MRGAFSYNPRLLRSTVMHNISSLRTLLSAALAAATGIATYTAAGAE